MCFFFFLGGMGFRVWVMLGFRVFRIGGSRFEGSVRGFVFRVLALGNRVQDLRL